MTQEVESDEVEELAKEIRRIIESNKQFLERVNDEDYDEEDDLEDDGEAEPDSEDEGFEEL